MARIILSELVNDIRNAIGTTVYSVWKGVHYIRRKAAQVSNPNSYYQAHIRARLTACSRRWYDALTDAQRQLWEEFAQQQGSADTSEQSQEGGQQRLIPDNRGKMSGINAYVYLNGLTYSAGWAALNQFLDDAPKNVTPPNAPYSLTAEYVSPPDKITLKCYLYNSGTVEETTRVRFWGMSTDAGAHKQIVTTQSVVLPPGEEKTCEVDITDVRGALGASIGLPLGHYLFQVDRVSDSGLKSPPSNIAKVTVE
jgi:hypothetical protein